MDEIAVVLILHSHSPAALAGGLRSIMLLCPVNQEVMIQTVEMRSGVLIFQMGAYHPDLRSSPPLGRDGSWIQCELARMPVAVHARRTCVVGVALGI
jgi:hypothetical protein